MMINAILIGNVMIAGSLAGFFFFVILATIVFDEPGEGSTAHVPEIEMGMRVIPTEAHIECWIDAMLSMHTVIDILNVTKVDADGAEEPGALPDLFPLGGPATGKGRIQFTLAVIDRNDMPDLSNSTRSLIPMAYLRASTLNGLARSFLKMSAMSLKYIKFLVIMTILGGLGMMGLGAILIFLAIIQKPEEPEPETDIVEYTQ